MVHIPLKTLQVYHQLTDDILSGKLAPGTRLIVRDLARRLGISDSPVREGLRMLERDGLVEFVPYRGARVAELHPHEVDEAYMIRGHLEALATRLAAAHLTPSDYDTLARMVAQMDEAIDRGDSKAYAALNRAFHQAIYSRCSHQRIVQLIATLWNEHQKFQTLFWEDAEWMRRSNRQHLDILRFLKAGDVEKAAKIILEQKLEFGVRLAERLRHRNANGPRRKQQEEGTALPTTDQRTRLFLNVVLTTHSGSKSPVKPSYSNGTVAGPAAVGPAVPASWWTYGWREGIWRLLRLLDEVGVRATVQVAGAVADQHPEAVKAVVSAGHHVCARSWTEDVVPLGPAGDQDGGTIEKTLDALRRASGSDISGWITPGSLAGEATRSQLARHGIVWHRDALEADRPFVESFPSRSLVAIPAHPEVSDLQFPVAGGPGSPGYVETVHDVLESIARLDPEDRPFGLHVTVHAHHFGKPLGAAALRELLRRVQSLSTVTLSTYDEVATDVLARESRKHR